MSIFVHELSADGDGLRVAVKDSIDVAGVPTIAGCRALSDASPAAADALVVQRLRAADCRIIGKTTMHELAFGVTGINDWAGTPLNPTWPLLVPGGSSSGSAAAVAAGLADFALGTDTGGAIRIPAACCGVFGLKPTFGRISRRGVLPAHSSIDCVGPFAASAEMLTRAMEIMDPTFVCQQADDLKVGRVDVAAQPVIQRAVAGALAASGLGSTAVALPGLEAAFTAGVAIINAETWAAFSHLLPTGVVGADVAKRLAHAQTTTPEEVAAAESVRAAFTAQVDALLEACDVLLLPTMPDPPPPLATARADLSAVGMTRFVRPFNLSGASRRDHTTAGDPIGAGRPADRRSQRRGCDGSGRCRAGEPGCGYEVTPLSNGHPMASEGLYKGGACALVKGTPARCMAAIPSRRTPFSACRRSHPSPLAFPWRWAWRRRR